ncbi:MAG: pentapeptide repeat-containing protein [Rectinemataceae bacterium]|nr:pentapeptide repeat-containing protein [Rectinemataceae bacterium]
MFMFSSCSEPGCERQALSDATKCSLHHPALASYRDALAVRIAEEASVKDLCLSGITFEGQDFSRRKFICCSFTGATFRNTLFTGSVFRLCFFDAAFIESCDFSGIDAEFCSFADVDIIDTSFENSELIHINFDGTRIRESTFTGSNLYDSRFILSVLENSNFSNCDMKKVYFIPARIENVSLKASNTNEAIRDMEHLYL